MEKIGELKKKLKNLNNPKSTVKKILMTSVGF